MNLFNRIRLLLRVLHSQAFTKRHAKQWYINAMYSDALYIKLAWSVSFSGPFLTFTFLKAKFFFFSFLAYKHPSIISCHLLLDLLCLILLTHHCPLSRVYHHPVHRKQITTFSSMSSCREINFFSLSL